MNQTTISATTGPAPIRAAAIMTAAGLAFAGLNVAVQWATMVAGTSAPAVAFWQYLIALVLGLPLVWRNWAVLRTRHPGLHLLRVLLAAAGVQVGSTACRSCRSGKPSRCR